MKCRTPLFISLVVLASALGGSVPGFAQTGRFLGKEDILIYGLGLRVDPVTQTVPKDIATIVSTYLQAPQIPSSLPPFAPDAVVKGTLRGPGLQTALELHVQPNSPFNIPPLTVAGAYTLENIRLESQGAVLLRSNPESVKITVIEKLLVTEITARALTAAEIREKGIVFDSSNFQAYNFTAAFAVADGNPIQVNFPVLLPSVQPVADVSSPAVTIGAIPTPAITSLKTVIPDTLKLATQIPNLTVLGFSLEVPELKGQDLIVPPIPGVIVIPGDIGFLNQYFSVMLMVGNGAPAGSGLSVANLQAEIILPAGNDRVANSADDPLRMATTARGEAPRMKAVVQAGPDGQLGTADDITTLEPGESGNAEFLVEGRREGSHTVEMSITGTLLGLPVGPVAVTGRAVGAVLVRNPTFTLTFTHPEIVAAGEPYTLDITVTNTSTSPANFVSVNLHGPNISGATLVGEPTREIESIAPGDSATVSFDLVSRVSGKVTAATLDSDENVAGRFQLKTAVGADGVPLSPDSLVLPKEASSLPRSLRDAALGLLGKAWAVATAPAGALPKDLKRFSRQIVLDRAVEVAEAGFRVSLHEPLADSAAQLLMDFAGSNYGRLAARYPAADLPFHRENFENFDLLRRSSTRGDVFAAAVANLLAPGLASSGAAAFHQSLAATWNYRPGFVSVLLSSSSAPAAFDVAIVDAQGRRVGGSGTNGKFIKEIPFSDVVVFNDAGGQRLATLLLLATPDTGTYTIRLTRLSGTAPDATSTLSVLAPTGDQNGDLRQLVFDGVTAASRPAYSPAAGDPVTFSFEMVGSDVAADPSPIAGAANLIPDAPPTVVSVVQQAQADVVRCDRASPGVPMGRVVAVLFSEEVTAASVQDRLSAPQIAAFLPESNRAVGVALQPGRRIAFVAMREPFGPFVQRTMTVTGVEDFRQHALGTWTGPMESTIGDHGAVVSGRVIQGDGTPVVGADVRLFAILPCDSGEEAKVGIAAKRADGDGRYSWDFVNSDLRAAITAIDPATEEFRSIPFDISRPGQRMNVDIVLLGRGTFTGRVISPDGRTPLPKSQLRVTSLTDHSQYGATTDIDGAFTIARIPVGNIFVEAVNVDARAHFNFSEYLPFAGAVVSRDIVLIPADSVQQTAVKYASLSGHVLKADGSTPVAGAPVVAYYSNNSQPGVMCPASGGESPPECAVGLGTSAADGAFTISDIPAGSYRIYAFDQPSLAQGEVRFTMAEGSATLTVLLTGGLATVRGTVLDAAGARVPSARVGGGLTLTTADANGAFELTDVPVGRRTIVAVSDALGVQGSADVDIVAAGEIVNVTIVLPAQGSVSGRVVLADGTTPAVDVNVYLFKKTEGGIAVVGQATTDATGGYRIDRILPDQYQVSAFAGDFSDGNIVSAVLRYDKQVLRADVRFRGAGGRVSGTVFNSTGNTPLVARVGITGIRLQIAGGRVGVAFVPVTNYAIVDTGFDGKFSFNNLFIGDFTLRAVGPFSPDPIEGLGRIDTPGQQATLDLRLQATSQVAGIVYQPDGVTPAANVTVSYKSAEFRTICKDSMSSDSGQTCETIPQGIQAEYAVTDANGRFLVPLVNAGKFALSFEDPATGKVAQVQGTVRPGERAEMVGRLLGRGTLTVRVIGSDGHTPIPGAKVEVQEPEFPKAALTMFADVQGVLELSGGDALSEGEVTILARDVRNGFTGRASARIAADNDLVSVDVFIFDAWGTVSGTVYKPDGITPVANAEVVISVGGKALGYTVTGANGAYSQDTVPLGAFGVDVFEAATGRIGYGSGRIDLDKQQVIVNVTEVAVGLVTGTALDSSVMAPLPGWNVTLSPHLASGRTLPTLQGMTAADGRFSFPGVAKGVFTLSLSKRDAAGSATATAEIYSEGQLIDVPLLVRMSHPLYGTIQGVVRNPDGTPASYATVTTGGRDTVAAADGSFSFADLTLGRYRVDAKAQSSSNAGSVTTELAYNGDVVQVTIPMVGLTAVHGQVVFADNSPASGAQVTFLGLPATGCGDGGCGKFAGANGEFSFIQLPARSFTVWASDPIRGLKGSVGGALNPGEDQLLRIVLQPSADVRGRVLTAGGTVASDVTCEMTVGGQHLFLGTGTDGRFSFPAVPLGAYTLEFSDPIGPGIARRSGTVTGDLDFGDVVLDEAPPQVASLTPAASASRVPLNQVLTIVFSEPIDPAGVTAAGIVLAGPSGPVTSLLALGSGDTTVTLTPLSPLKDESRYTLKITGVEDRLSKVMNDYTASFTTVDITPPAATDLSPAQGASGVPVYSTIRIKFSEPIDPVAWGATPFSLTQGSTPVTGRFDYLYGNTVVAFTPTLPLSDGAGYRAQLAAAHDLAGNVQAQGLDFVFSTTDRTPPQIASLSAVSGPTVIENTVARVRPDFGGAADVAVVDYYLNGAVAGSSRTASFEFAFQATPALGKPGDTIAVTAIATDTSGNRGVISSALSITVAPDQPPAITITAPADASAFRNGAHVSVSVGATDDVGLTALAYRAQTGKPQDAATVQVSPAATSRTATFAFDVPNDAVPGSAIQIQASAVDSKGQTTAATPVSFTVLDAVAPVASLSGSASGDKVRAGQAVTVTLNATDAGGLKRVTFAATGAASASETRPVAGAPKSMVTAFSFTVSPTAVTGDTIALDATATDLADNVGTAARVVLTLADITPPSATLRTADGSTNVLPGQTVDLIAQATDDQAVTRIDLAGTGAFTVSDSQQVSPPSNTATRTFPVIIPSSIQPGALLTLTARATDVSGNVSGPATVVLLVGSSLDITMPASIVVLAGETTSVTVQLSTPAGAGGQLLTFATASPSIATAPAAATIPEGQTQTTIAVTALSGGTTALRAYVQGVPRGTTTVAVQGGVISGRVLDDQLVPVSGVEITVDTTLTATSGQDGAYQVTGASGGTAQVKALDPVSQKRGSTTATLNQANGFAKNVNVVLIAAGSVVGTVYARDGVTPAGGGVQVDIYDQASSSASLNTTFTDAGSHFEFPVVTQGSYVLEARGAGGNRGQSTVLVPAGQTVTAIITFLGTGTIAGVVRDGGSTPVPNAQLQLTSTSLFGGATPTTIATGPDGSFSFTAVFVGNFYLRATDPRNGQAGVASGVVGHDQETVSIDVYVASFGSLQGTVYRSDGTTTVANASVIAERDQYTRIFATTDSDGKYLVPVAPLGSYTVSAYEPSTRGVGQAETAITANGQQQTADIVLMPQGTLIVTVNDAVGQMVAGATVSVQSANGAFRGGGSGLTGEDGRVVVQHVLAGTFTVDASSGQLSGRATGNLAGNATVSVTVQLQPVAAIAGVVYLPNGQTPAAGRVDLTGATLLQASLAADGSYRFDGLALGQYQLKVYDESGRFRAAASWFQLSTPGQVATRNLIFVGLGTVSGRVFNIDSSSAGNTAVQVQSLHVIFGGFQGTRTDAAGYYQITNVPVGPVAVLAGDVSQGIFAESSGTLTADGQNVVVDLLLKNNSTYFPVSLYDANGEGYYVSQPGTIRSSDGYAFSANGGFKLELETGGVTTAFAGSAVGTLEAGGRQVVARQQAVAGLDVTRRVFVPADGYFARYIDMLTNPGSSPVTVSLWVTSYTGLSSLIKTSSGDATISVADVATADRWFSIDDSTDGWSSPRTLAFVFDGPGGAVRASAADFAPSNSAYWRRDNVTVPAGGSVAFMHFVVQHGTRAGAQTGAERLVQLPPEALASLRPDELAAIRNFAVPADGLSALGALPALTGTILGQALDADGVSPVPYTPVTFTSASPYFNKPVQMSADATGSFRFDGAATGVPGSFPVSLEPFSLAATYPTSGMSAPTVAGAFGAGQSVATQNVLFSTVASMRGVVTRSDGTAVTSGTVTLSGTFNGYNYARNANIGPDGSFSFAGQPAIAVTLTASVPHPQGTANSGTSTAVLSPGQTENVTITLPATGSVTGTVRTGAGTGAANVTVSLSGPGFARSMRTDTAGALSFGLVPAGTYTLTATEPASSLTTAASVTVVSDQATTQDLQLVSVGIVRGTVKDSNNAISAGTSIELTPSVTSRGILRTSTDGSGGYQFTGVPLGTFKVTATNVSLGQYGETTGSLTSDGQQAVADITMASNVVSLPRTMYDANSLSYDIQRNGRIRNGDRAAFRGPTYNANDPYGASMLSLVASGVETAFAGAATALGEHGNRELAIRQQGIAGLDVTRKVFLPATGYFVRYLEILSNPGAAAVTVDVKVASTLGNAYWYYDYWWGSRLYGVRPSLVTTSTGDAVLDLNGASPDRWVVFDDSDQTDVFDPAASGSSLPASAFVFDGPGASQRVAAATFTTPDSGLLTYQWDAVTVPAGGTVILMHLVLQQSSTAAATASAQRLVQLPPEAIVGIADDERPSIANFAVPADGSSPVTPLPALTGTVTGRVLNVDTTTVENAQVRFVSSTPYFSRTRTVYSDYSGGFQFASSFGDYQNTIIPVGAFTLTARHPATSVVSPATAGTFAADQVTATQDVVFSNTAVITGIVTKQSGVAVPSQYVTLSNGSANYGQYTDAAGRFTFRGLPSGTWTLNATLSGSQWLTLSGAVSSVAGQTTTGDFAFAATGAVQGVVYTATGELATYVSVYIKRPSDGAYYGVYSYDGSYVFQDIPAGSYSVYAYDYRTNAKTEMPVTIAADQVTTQNLTLPAAGSLQIQVNFARGSAAGGSYINVMDVAGNGNFNNYVYADAAGRATLTNVAAGPITVRAYSPSDTTFYTDATTTLVNEGDTVSVTVTLPGLVTVTTHTATSAGTAVPYVSTSLYASSNMNSVLRSGQTDDTGMATLGLASTGTSYTATGRRSVSNYYGYVITGQSAAFTPTTDGDVVTAEVVMPAVANTTVALVNPDGTSFGSAYIYLQNAYLTNFQYQGTTGTNGLLTVPLPEGANVIQVEDYNTGAALVNYTATIGPEDEGVSKTITITVGAPAGTVTGQVFSADGVTPIASARVYLINALDGLQLEWNQADAAGRYTFSNVRAGSTGFIIRAKLPSSVSDPTTVDVAASFSTAGETKTVNVTMPFASMTVSGTVFAADGISTISSVRVELRNASNTLLATLNANSSGVYGPYTLLVGSTGLTVRAYDPSRVVYGEQVQLPGATGGTFAVNVTVPVLHGTIQGTVVAADGQTGVPYAWLQVKTATGTLTSFSANADGTFTYGTYLPSADGTLTASYSGGVVADRTPGSIPVAFASANATLNVTMTLPLSVVKGYAKQADGSPVGNLYDATTVGDDSQTRRVVAYDPTAGTFVVLGTPPGPFRVYVTDGNSPGFTGFAGGAMGDITTPVQVEVTLPAIGTADVFVTNTDGQASGYTWIGLSAPGTLYVTSARTDATGHVVMSAPAGPVSFQACPGYGPCGIVSGTISGAQTTSFHLRGMPTGSVDMRAFKADGVTPYANFDVWLESYSGAGYQGAWSSSATTDANGRFAMTGVPAGSGYLELYNSTEAIRIKTTVEAGRTTTIQASGGTGLASPSLTSNGASYSFDYRGRLISGSFGSLSSPYNYSYGLRVNDYTYYPFGDLTRLMDGQQQLEFGPGTAYGLIVQRKVAKPGSKPFLRYIETVRNPTSVPLPVSVLINTSLPSLKVVTPPSATGNRYVITSRGNSASYAAAAHVMGGADTPRVKPGVSLVTDSSLDYVWATVVPAGGTVEFMHFSVIGGLTDVAGLQAQAQALVDLTDPDALAGLSDEEKARIVNFTVPGGKAENTGSVLGSVVLEDGVTPLAGATVQAHDAITGYVRATATTDATGAFRFDNVANGEEGVALTATLDAIPGSSAGAAVTFTQPGQVVSGLVLTFSAGEVSGRVTALGSPVASPVVMVSQTDGNGTVSTLRAYASGADGRFVVLGVKPGVFTLMAIDGTGQVGTTVQGTYVAGTALAVDVPLPAGPTCTAAPAGLLGFWRGEAGAEDSVHPGSDGTLQGTAAIAPARVGNGFLFDGSSALLQVPDSGGNLGPATITVSAWVMFNSLDSLSTPQDGEQYIVFKKKGTIGPRGWVEGFALSKTRVSPGDDRFAFWAVTPDEQDLWSSEIGRTSIEPGRYYHVVGTVDGAAGRLYVDGVLEATFPFAYPVDGGDGPLAIGGGDVGGWDPRCSCVVDEVQVFDRALGVDEVQAMYAATSAGICADLQVLPAMLPATYVGVSMTDTLRAVNGLSPVAFSGTDTPPGLIVTAPGQLTGVPTTAGTFTFIATATDATNAFASRQITKTVLPCVNLPTGLVSLWSGEDNALDSMGVNNGTLERGQFDPGKVGRAFFGYDLRMSSQTPPGDLADTFTVEFWALPVYGYDRSQTTESTSGIIGVPNQSTQRYAVAPEHRSGADGGAGLSVGANGVSVFEHGDSYLPSTLVYNTTISNWTHIALVYENKTPKLYINGAFVRTGLTSPRAHVYAPKSLGDAYGYGYYFGRLDEVALYSRALTGAEIQTIFAAGGEARCATVQK